MENQVLIGKDTLIYALCEYPSLEPRYIGKTTHPLRERFKSHLRSSRKNPRLPVHRWIAKRDLEENYICIRLIETVKAGENWQNRESYWINVMRNKKNSRILNLTNGGEGLSGHIFSENHKNKISNALRTGEEISCLVCGTKVWRKRNEIDRGNNKFCSKKCYQSTQKGKKKKTSYFSQAAVSAAAAAKRNKTNCKRGHLLSGNNLFVTTKGVRICKECRKLHKEKYMSRIMNKNSIKLDQIQGKLI